MAADAGATPEFLAYGRHLIDDADIAAVIAVLRSGSLAQGPEAARFEQDFAAAVAAPHAAAVSCGTAALHLAYRALDVGPGDLVITPAITFLSTATAALMCGAQVALCDVDPRTGLMTPETLARAIGEVGRTVKVVSPVHLAGRPADVAGIADVARSHGARVVEDACHALGGRAAYGGPVGDARFSDAATFSFHPVKTRAAGEGGMVTTRDPDLAERVRRLRNHGVTRAPAQFQDASLALDVDGRVAPWVYEQQELGYNYRLSDIHAALGRSQLAKLASFIARRAEIAARYDAAFAELDPRLTTIPAPAGTRPGLHLYVAHIDFAKIGRSRSGVMAQLAARGVGAQVHYIPLYRQPAMRAVVGEMRLPGAERYYASALALPLFPGLHDADVERVIAAVHSALKGEASP
jgi:UDP-4-amino-4,6-dideoxy-N-acetyl-beta-L-altrosamine transaminase